MPTTPVYVVLELDEPVASHVLALRRACHDAFRASLPAEITLAGTGGVGPLEEGQAIEDIDDALQDIAARTPVLRGAFGSMRRFPNTDVFVLTVRDEAPFHALHSEVTRSSLRFKPSRFPFQPHCTISSNAVTHEEAQRRLQWTLPEPFSLSTLALYGLDDGRITRLAWATLQR